MKKLIQIPLLLFCATCFGANPTFNSFEPTQFSSSSSANKIAVGNGASVTNLARIGGTEYEQVLSGTNNVIDFTKSCFWNAGTAAAVRFNLSNIPTTNATDLTIVIAGQIGSQFTNVADNIIWLGPWGVFNAQTNKIFLHFSGSTLTAFQDPMHGVVTPAQITSNQNDYDLGVADEARINSDAARSINGIKGRPGGQELWIENTGAFTITLANQNAGSASTNRFDNGADVPIAAKQSAKLIYDLVSLRWRVDGNWSSGGGSGNVVNTGTSVVGNRPRYTDTTGTAVSPGVIVEDASGNETGVLSISVSKTALGTTTSDGILLQNTTAAAVGAQQVSPSTHYKSFGWATAAGGSSQLTDWQIYNLPTQGTSPSSSLIFAESINGGSYFNAFTLTSAGIGNFTSDVIAASTFGYRISGRSYLKSSADGLFELFNNAASGFTRLNFGGTSASFPALKVNGTTLQHRLADDSADGPMSASTGTFSSTITSGGNSVPTSANNLSFFSATTSAQLAGVISDESGSGSLLFGTSPTITTPTISGAISFPSGTRQAFAPNATTPGISVGSNAGDPSTPANGDLWYDSTGNLLRARINGASVSLGAAGGGGTVGTLINTAATAAGQLVTFSDNQKTNTVASPIIANSTGDFSLVNSIAATNTTANNGMFYTNGSATIYKNAIGVTQTDAFAITNGTLATVGAQQQSGAIHLGGQGWKTGATAASQPVDFAIYVQPVQGSTSPTENLIFSSSVNGSAYVSELSLSGAGLLASTAGMIAGSSSSFQINGRSQLKSGANATVELVDAAGTSPAQLRNASFTATKTANYTVTTLDSGTYFNNIGAAGAVTNTLPTAAAGLTYAFYVDAAQTVTIVAGASTTIRYGATVTAAAGNVTSSTQGAFIKMIAISSTQWIVEALNETLASVTGPWTFN